MTTTILVTGFEPFGGMPVNPTEQLVSSLREAAVPGATLHAAVLPVTYDECASVVRDLLDRHQPDAVIACGLAAGRAAVTPERIAVNVKDTASDQSIADNSGRRPTDEPIAPDGPDGLFSTLPVRQIVEALQDAGIPAAVSNTAGTYICNNTMYAVLDHLRRAGRDVPAGFIHFPASTEMAVDDPRLSSLPMATMERALQVAIETVVGSLAAVRPAANRT